MNHFTKDEIALATHIAESLNDQWSLQQHLQFVRKFKGGFLLRQLALVMAKPDSEIIKSRAAYYMTLIKRNGSSPSTWN